MSLYVEKETIILNGDFEEETYVIHSSKDPVFFMIILIWMITHIQ